MYRQRKKRLQKTMAATLMFAGIVFVEAQTPKKPLNSDARKIATVSELIVKGEFAAAKVLLRQLIAAEPRNGSAHTLAGVVADRQKDLSTAEKHFAIAARLQPNSPEARNNYGAILFRLGRADEAARELQASIRANPNQPSAQINLAQIYFLKGTTQDLQAARKLFEKVFAGSPDAEIARALVVISLRLGESAPARQGFQQYAALSGIANLPVQTRIEFGASLLENNLFNEAAIELEAAVAAEPNNVGAVILLSRVYLAQKNIKAAGRLLEATIARGVGEGKIYAALADVYEAGGFYENAIPAMRLAIDTDKTNQAYRYRYGMMLVDTKTPAAAIIRLREAVQEFPDSARLWLGLGIAQFQDSKLTDAQQSLEKSLILDARLVPAFAYLAAIKNINGQAAAAAAYYERALEAEEASGILHYLLADTLLKDATVDDAKVEKHLVRAIKLDARLALAHLALGRFYVRQKRFAEAATAFEKTVSLEPNRAEAFYQLGQVYVRLKRADESRAALAKFKELSELEKTQTKNDYSELVRRLANVKF